jgi:DNA-binding LacI/PurR family transcriptional regulator
MSRSLRSRGVKSKIVKKLTRGIETQWPKRLGATQHDVARLADVSQSAVSRVFRNAGYVADDVRERIEAAAIQLRYQPDALARGLITGRSTIVAIVMADIVNPFYPYVLDVMTDGLQKRGLQALLFNAARGQSIDDLLHIVLQYKVKGIVITTASLSSKATTLCADQGVPVVMFNRYTRLGSAHAVACDNVLGGRTAAHALLTAGCRNLAYIGGVAESSTNEDRKNGFLQGLSERRVLPYIVVDKEFTYNWGSDAVDHVFKKFPQLDGLFCADDVIAFGAIDSLRYNHDRRVPLDVSVVGFDDIPAAGWPAYNLTTIRQPVDEMVDAALSCIALPATSPHQIWQLPGQLVIRQSLRQEDSGSNATTRRRSSGRK